MDRSPRERAFTAIYDRQVRGIAACRCGQVDVQDLHEHLIAAYHDHAPWAPWPGHAGCPPSRGPSDDQVRRLLDQVAAGLPARDRRLYDLVVRRGAGGREVAEARCVDLPRAGLLLRDLRRALTGGLRLLLLAREAPGCLGVDGWDRMAFPRRVRLAVERHLRVCDACGKTAEEAVRRHLPGLVPVLLPAMREEMLARIARPSRGFGPLWQRASAVVLVVAALVLLAAWAAGA
ncbi:hypothetical protein [Herbidospora sp. NBRC 101105]|uniref:hypothetical protein n=1 Tax=Herbidospora sp. NBRC 101105 TaxID=3032195 RepID=UPI0024A36789|nr:hypothetical protein [Herbidospora sp. NBRC 101105]GLX93495.1 hypothetical protein Hesp01_14450 [Herbidospora sp. NBRC 101105]